MPSQGYQIGDYLVDRESTLTGPESTELIAALAAKVYAANEKQPNTFKPDRRKWWPGQSV